MEFGVEGLWLRLGSLMVELRILKIHMHETNGRACMLPDATMWGWGRSFVSGRV